MLVAGDVAMRNEYLNEIGETLFAVAIAAAIGLGAVNLAIQVNKDRAAFDAAAASQKLGQLTNPPGPAGAPESEKSVPAS
jgi:hypothetical protein